jgi:8-oxo-dGTP pyrophosphatase MutT (NUDIX family)
LEAGETQQDALRREFREEVGGNFSPIARIWEYREPGGGLTLHWWLGTSNAADLVANPHEASELAWFTLAEIASLPDVLPSNLAARDGLTPPEGA